MKIRLCLDEDVDVAFASALRQRGIDVLTTQEAGKRQQTDDAQLEYAVQAGRVSFTHNRGDFARLHGQRVQEDRPHAGVMVSDQFPLRILLRRLSRLCFSLTQQEMMGRLECLGSWR